MERRRYLILAGVGLFTVCGICALCMFPAAFLFSPVRYQAWASGPQTGGPQTNDAQSSKASSGEELFTQLGCSACHRSDGGGLGPSLVGLYNEAVELEDGSTVIADEEYLRRSILDSRANIVAGYPPIMPQFEGQVSEEEAGLLVDYIQSLE